MKKILLLALILMLRTPGLSFGAVQATVNINGVPDLTNPTPPPPYEPMQLRIMVGDSVVWANTDDETHTATSTSGPQAFDTTNISPGKTSQAVTFTQAGSYTYRCDIHKTTMMGASITVSQPVSSPSPSPSPPPPSPSPSPKPSPSPSPSPSASPSPSPSPTEVVTGAVDAPAPKKKEDDGGLGLGAIVAIVAFVLAAASGGGLWYLKRTGV